MQKARASTLGEKSLPFPYKKKKKNSFTKSNLNTHQAKIPTSMGAVLQRLHCVFLITFNKYK